MVIIWQQLATNSFPVFGASEYFRLRHGTQLVLPTLPLPHKLNDQTTLLFSHHHPLLLSNIHCYLFSVI